MRYWIPGIVFLLLTVIGANAGAATRAQERAAFKNIASDIQKGDLDGVPGRIEGLKDYVLYPYLGYAYLKAKLNKGDHVDGAVEHFLARWHKLPVTQRLRNRWLRQLAKREDWARFHANYKSTSLPRLRCDDAVARLKLAHDKEAEPGEAFVRDALSLWLTGRDRPKACDPVFHWLKKHGHLTPARYQKRVDLALKRGHTRLAEYLARRQQGKAQKRTRRRIALIAHPQSELSQLAEHHEKGVDTAHLTQALGRLAYNHPEKAIPLYKKLGAAYGLSESQRRAVVGHIALGFSFDGNPKSLDWFSKLTGGKTTATIGAWRITAALYQQDWDAARAWLEDLPASEAKKPRWRYWRARVLNEQGHTKKARAIYQRLVEGNGYYAWLAAGRLGQPYYPHSQSIALQLAAVKRIKARPGVIRARELFKVGWYRAAGREWHQALSGASSALWEQAALLAQQWGWHSQAIASVAKGHNYKDLQLRYPLAYRGLIMASAHKRDIPAAWVYGMIRTESLFKPKARSYSGARGLMQLMPATARWMAKLGGDPLSGADALYTPGRNVRLGSRYLARVLRLCNGNVVLATAAYNAGPGRVKKWMPDKAMPADIWVENIPYIETRHYVKRVLKSTAIFQWRLLQHVAMPESWMAPVGMVAHADE